MFPSKSSIYSKQCRDPFLVSRVCKGPLSSAQPIRHIKAMRGIRRVSIAKQKSCSVIFMPTTNTRNTLDVSHSCCRTDGFGHAVSEQLPRKNVGATLGITFWSRRVKPPKPVGSEALRPVRIPSVVCKSSPPSRWVLRDFS